jgi:imidazolonepropionase-like amidohydrolase
MVKSPPAVLLLLLGLASCSPRDAKVQSRNAIAIVDVTVVDVQRGIGLPHKDVVVDGDGIAFVGPSAGQVPSGASVISGKGRFLIPGLWDMHIHVASDPRALALLLAAGITGARDMGGDPKQVLENRRRTKSGELYGPRLFVAGPMLAGPPSEADDSTWVIRTPEEASKAVASLAGEGVDFIKVHDHLSRETYRAVADSAKAKGIPFSGHVSEYVTPVEASEIGQKSIEHFEFLPKPCMALFDPKRPAIPAGCDYAALDSLMKTFARNGTWLDPTVGAFRYFAPDQWTTIKSAYRSLAALIRGNGVKVLAGTDQSSYLESKGSVPGRSLHDELTFFVDAGFTPAEALRAATTGPAEFLGLADSVGTIQAGRSADLVLLDANPLQDISNTRRIAVVIKQGHLYDSAVLTRLRNLKP